MRRAHDRVAVAAGDALRVLVGEQEEQVARHQRASGTRRPSAKAMWLGRAIDLVPAPLQLGQQGGRDGDLLQPRRGDDAGDARMRRVAGPAGRDQRAQHGGVVRQHDGDEGLLHHGRRHRVHVHGVEVERLGDVTGDEVGEPDADAVAMRRLGQPHHGDLGDEGHLGVGHAADVGAPAHGRVDAGARHVLADALDDQPVESREGQPRHRRLGAHQQPGIDLGEVLRLADLDDGELLAGVLHQRDAGRQRRALGDALGQPGQHVGVAGRADAVDLPRALRLAEPHGQHLGQPALDGPGKARMRLDAVDDDHAIRRRRTSVEAASRPVGQVAVAHRLHRGAHGAAHRRLRDAEPFQHRRLPLGRAAAMRAHGGHDERRVAARLQPVDRAARHAVDVDDAPAAHGDGDRCARRKRREPRAARQSADDRRLDIVERGQIGMAQAHAMQGGQLDAL